jgi:hypothetical protein
MISRLTLVLMLLTLMPPAADPELNLGVFDADSVSPLPCRVTIVDSRKNPAAITPRPGQNLAVRPGVLYTPNGASKFSLPAGEYTLYATRGMEYGVAHTRVRLGAGDRKVIRMMLRREVATPGLVAADLHMHTGTYAGHGDATIEERAITIAGEGIELAVMTEHNRLVDLSETVARMGLARYFTTILGDEVSTAVGHFNAFPIAPGSAPPDHESHSWETLLRSMRATPGLQVVSLNHPRDLHSNYRPFGPENFNPESGENRTGQVFGFDCLEVLNSGALQSDLLLTFRDWFALLNSGHRITAVAGSDGHDVTRYIVGQGRTYIQCPDTDPGHLDADQVCRALLGGRASVSMGLLPLIRVNGRFGSGDLATDVGKTIHVEVQVLSPSWARADLVQLYADGIALSERRLSAEAAQKGLTTVSWNIPRPEHDIYLVAIATGPGITEAFWPIPKPYQPTSPEWIPRVLGATNPVLVDVDGDGKYTTPREYASGLVEKSGSDATRLLAALHGYDRAVAVQAAALCHAAGIDIRSAEWKSRLDACGWEPAEEGFAAFLRTLEPEQASH